MECHAREGPWPLQDMAVFEQQYKRSNRNGARIWSLTFDRQGQPPWLHMMLGEWSMPIFCSKWQRDGIGTYPVPPPPVFADILSLVQHTLVSIITTNSRNKLDDHSRCEWAPLNYRVEGRTITFCCTECDVNKVVYMLLLSLGSCWQANWLLEGLLLFLALLRE